MVKKRKSDATRLDEVDRSMYSTFCSAANSLSQIYTQAMAQQKVSFQAGERHALEKLHLWILRQHEEGAIVTAAEVVAYLQNEIDYGGEDASMSPRLQFPNHPQTTMHFMNTNIQASSGVSGPATVVIAPRTGHSDQMKNSIFSNALSSPIHYNLQPYDGGYYPSVPVLNGSGTRNHEVVFPNQICDSNSLNSNDSSMDMHSDSPPHESD
ncbi:Holocarboxylase synthetase [Cocos nucifera]|uniref:Holocarboxylase synthetase n=1 Tax=Cocos nucifera TaxID=13894 RepID=A0A8K0HX55_COCNU|nr:Holocarboxylase synthetase [Cocos nucifera]